MTARVAITVLTQPDCAWCDHAKRVLNQVSTDYPIQVIEIDLTSDEGRALARKAGVLFAPGVLIDGEPFSFGRLSERKLRRTLAEAITDRAGRAVTDGLSGLSIGEKPR